jgi:hypothetical protein
VTIRGRQAWIAAIHSETPIAAPLTVLFSLATVGAAIVLSARSLARRGKRV